MPQDSLQNSIFMKAIRREATSRPPVWMMRQAGRYMKEYRAVRENASFLELCKNPSLCAEVMVTAVDRLGVDAAILFSDLLPILEPLGFSLSFGPGHGPIIHNPVRESSDVKRLLRLDDISPLGFVFEAVRATRAALPDDKPLIGFAGAPFTLASYAIEGGSSRNFAATKKFMYENPAAFAELMDILAEAVELYLVGQIDAGAQVVQLFDSWIGCLGPGDYERFVAVPTRRILQNVGSRAPVIHFGTGNPALIPLMTQAGGQVIGVDWRVDLATAWEMIDASDDGLPRGVQGNLDPAVLLTSPDEIYRQTRALIDSVHNKPGLILNLGHGILPQTPVENAIAFVKAARMGN